MHTPPTVEYPVGPSGRFRWAWRLLWALTLTVQLAWLWLAGPGAWAPWIGLLVALSTAVAATYVGSVVRAGVLVWDTNSWWWEHGSERTSGLVTSELDLQSLLLLRFVSDAGMHHWFWLERGTNPVRWPALRRAVFAPRGWSDAGGGGDDHAKGSDRVIGS